MISVLSLILGVAIIGLICAIFGVLLSFLMGLLGVSTKKVSFSESFEAAIASLKPAFITAAILTIPGCYALLTPASDIPEFLFHPNRFGENDDIISGFFIFIYIFTPVFLLFYLLNLKHKL